MLKNKSNAIYVCILSNVKIANNSFENVEKFQYFEQHNTNKNCIQSRNEEQIQAKKSCSHSYFFNILSSC
jgi:hypothetical protein